MNPDVKKTLRMGFLKNVVVNLVAATLIFYALCGDGNTVMGSLVDVLISMIVSGLVGAGIQLLTARLNIKHGKEKNEFGSVSQQLAFIFMPKNMAVFFILNALVFGLIFAFVPMGLWLFSPNLVMGRFAFAAFKGVSAAFLAGFGNAYSTFFFSSMLQEKAASDLKG